MDIAEIMLRRYPGTQWAVAENDYDKFEWFDVTPKPTRSKLEKLWPEVQYEKEYESVEMARAEAYRETSDPLFFKYQRGTATEQEWLAAVQAVKDAHPYLDEA